MTPTKLSFTKMQGLGNDFVVLDGRSDPSTDWSALAVRLCDRHFGIGGDGLLTLTEDSHTDVAMRMFNPDGSEDFCGNGLRCIARYAVDRLGRPAACITIATIHGARKARLLDSGLIEVDMRDPLFHPRDIPMDALGERVVDHELKLKGETTRITALSTGSTHAIVFVSSLPDDERFLRLSPLIEHHPAFPLRTSVMWTCVESRTRLSLRIWERGVGETLACGTGACAAMVAARVQGLVESEVTVHSKGGALAVRWDDGRPLVQTGPAEYVFEGEYRL